MNEALQFLVTTLCDLYAFVLLLRFVLQAVGANFQNPICQFTARVTSPVVAPVSRFIPTIKGYPVAILFVALCVASLKWLLVSFLFGQIPNPIGILILGIGGLCEQTINLFFFALLIGVILSWLPQFSMNPAAALLDRLTSPLLYPIRRVVPPIGGIDLSALFAIIGLKFLTILLVSPIMVFGQQLALS